MGSALYSFVGYSFVTWAPSFLMRSHAMESGEVGTWLALIIGIGGGVGVFFGGFISDRLSSRDPRFQAWVPGMAMIAGLPFCFPLYLTQSSTLCLILMVPLATFGLMYQGPAFAITQGLATPKMRATAAAALLFVINIIGLAMGPAMTGALSDLLEPRTGQESLRYALLINSMALAPSGYCFWRAAEFLVADFQYAREKSNEDPQSQALPPSA